MTTQTTSIDFNSCPHMDYYLQTIHTVNRFRTSGTYLVQSLDTQRSRLHDQILSYYRKDRGDKDFSFKLALYVEDTLFNN